MSFGESASKEHVTTYFRRDFTVDDATKIRKAQIDLRRDDGAVVYLNGREVLRENMPDGAIASTTLAASRMEDETFVSTEIDVAGFVTGRNVLAVEVHQVARSSASPAGVCNAPNAQGLVVVNTQTRVKAGRYASTDADTIHAPGMTLGPWVENDVFWGGMDDFVNLRPSALDVVSRTARSVTLSTSSHRVPVGDDVVVYRFSDGASVERKVVAVSGATLELDGGPGPGTRLYAYSQAAPRTVLRYNTLLGGKRYGFLLRTRGAVIEGNVFDRLAGSAVAFENHPWRSDEGVASRDVLVVGNEIRDNRDEQGAIFAAIMKCDTAGPTGCSRTIASAPRAMRDLRFVRNTVDGGLGHGIALHDATSGAIRCNDIGSSGGSDILVHATSKVTIEHNRIDAPLQLSAVTGLVQAGNGATANVAACLVAGSRRGADGAPRW